MVLLQNLHSILHGLSYGIKYHGPHTFHFPTIKKDIRMIGLIYGIRVCNNMVRVHLHKNNWNSTSIANVIWQSKTSNTYKSFTFPFQGIWQWLLVKQHKVHTLQKEKMSLNYKVFIPNTSKFRCQINGGDQSNHLTHEILKLQLQTNLL
jgi:hypothetical protein